MRVALIGAGGLAHRFAVRAQEAGLAVVAFGPLATAPWPAGISHTAYSNRDELAVVLAEHRPDVVVVFGPRSGDRQSAPPVVAVEATAAAVDARLIYWGSATVYGCAVDVRGDALLENAPLSNRSAAAAAVAADRAVQDLAATRPDRVHLFRASESLVGDSTDPAEVVGQLRIVPATGDRRHLQLLDLRDALEILDRAVRGEHAGTYNVSADGIMRVDEACRALGRTAARLPRLLHLAAAYLAQWTGKVNSARLLLRFTAGTPIVDNTRLKTHFGFRPRFTTRQALAAAREGR